MTLTVEAVSHRYGQRAVLSDVSFEVAEGETVALMGPSGSGKTTLLSIIGALIEPSEGRVLLDGEDLCSKSGAMLRSQVFAWVFQTVNVLGRRSAIDNVSLGLVARGHPPQRAREHARHALSAVGLGPMAERSAASLSGGELQRVCVARALAASPRLVLADEPTGQLDRRTSDEVADALIGKRTAESAVLIATHDPDVASRCQRVVRLVDGRAVEEGAA